MAHCSHLEAVDLVRAPQGQATRRLTGPEASDHVLRQRGRHVPDLHHFAAPVGRRGVPKGEGIHGHVAERGVLPLDDLGRYATLAQRTAHPRVGRPRLGGVVLGPPQRGLVQGLGHRRLRLLGAGLGPVAPPWPPLGFLTRNAAPATFSAAIWKVYSSVGRGTSAASPRCREGLQACHQLALHTALHRNPRSVTYI